VPPNRKEDAAGMDFSSVEAFRDCLAGFYCMFCISGLFFVTLAAERREILADRRAVMQKT
jgi:hypothetical protein